METQTYVLQKSPHFPWPDGVFKIIVQIKSIDGKLEEGEKTRFDIYYIDDSKRNELIPEMGLTSFITIRNHTGITILPETDLTNEIEGNIRVWFYEIAFSLIFNRQQQNQIVSRRERRKQKRKQRSCSI